MTTALATKQTAATPVAIANAAQCLRDGGLVAFPTETVYGLGADATNAQAVARLYAAKGRPSFNPLIAHVPTLAAARRLGVFNAAAEKLAKTFWPGPLTLVLPKAAGCPVAELATAGLDSIAIRMPAHPIARALLEAFAKPIVAPSANRSGHVSPTTAAHVFGDLAGRIDMILDGGATHVGIESTIVACLDMPKILRSGGVTRAALEAAAGQSLETEPEGVDVSDVVAPGMMASHYAPRARLRLNATTLSDGEVLLAFGPDLPQGADKTRVLNLSPSGDLVEAAANLFAHLRALDKAEISGIAAMPIPDQGLGEAINDRLRRAAAPRS
ncbi:MAG TPA: L-threonylcarbamoyladenylate synthase [Xanthobacteraceae bacterium]|jgi:L-threonylcarbamoyladenylate synthase|nr:L-threonylcarbamoyladenylate synthase [Xanthobacteraceae bacterium]